MTRKLDSSAAPAGPSRLTEGGAGTPDELAIASLLGKLPPGSPDDLQVERVWRRVTTPRVRASRPSRLGWVPALALVAAVLVVLVRWPHPVAAEVALSSGGVFSGALAEKWRASRSGDSLAEAERIRTDATGRALLRVHAVAAVLVREDSDVGLERLQPGVVLRLSRGTLTARVSKRSADAPFVVETDHYSVKVVGTLFTVEQGPGDHTVVSVREGVVEVSDGAGRVDRVVAGQRWVSESRDVRTPDRTPDAVKALLEAGLAGRPAADLAGPFVAALSGPAQVAADGPALAPAADRPATAAARAAGSGAPPGKDGADGTAAVERPETPAKTTRGGQTVVPDAPASALAPAAPALAAPSGDWMQQVAPAASVPAAAAMAPAVPPGAPASPPASPSAPPALAAGAVDEGPYARGLALEAKGDYQAAARELGRASDEDAAHADIATYALGRLAQRRLHDPARARAAFNRYRERYPHGPLLPEVDVAILEIEVDTHAEAEALADSARFLATHPGSERVDEVHLLRGNLLREAGRCREALDEYARVRVAPSTDHALYSTAYCQQKLGDRLAAAATLREYLARFPAGAHRAEAQRALSDE